MINNNHKTKNAIILNDDLKMIFFGFYAIKHGKIEDKTILAQGNNKKNFIFINRNNICCVIEFHHPLTTNNNAAGSSIKPPKYIIKLFTLRIEVIELLKERSPPSKQ